MDWFWCYIVLVDCVSEHYYADPWYVFFLRIDVSAKLTA